MVKRIPAGQMRHIITLQSYTAALNSYGQASTTGSWTTLTPDGGTVSDLRAKITPLRGEEATLARQVYPKAAYSVIIDHLSTMDTSGATQRRVLFGSRSLHIGAVLNFDEENFQQQLLCSEER